MMWCQHEGRDVECPNPPMSCVEGAPILTQGESLAGAILAVIGTQRRVWLAILFSSLVPFDRDREGAAGEICQ